jgi:hypothetical protein
VTTAFAQSVNVTKIKNRQVRYAAPSAVKVFPVPAIGWQRAGLASQSQRNEVLNKIVYPVINKSSNAIAAIIVEFYTDDKKSFGVECCITIVTNKVSCSIGTSKEESTRTIINSSLSALPAISRCRSACSTYLLPEEYFVFMQNSPSKRDKKRGTSWK